MAFPVTLNGRTYTLADFSGTNYVDGFPDALEDFVTQAGNIYTTTSTSSVVIGTGTKTFTVADSGKPYIVGTPLRIADAAAPATNWIDAIVTSYSGTTLEVNAIAYAGSGTISSWNINIGGSAVAYTGTLPVAQGGTGATTEAAARTNLDVYSKGEADAKFLDVSGEASNVTMTGDVTIGDAAGDTLTVNATATLADATITTADINGGTIDGVTLGTNSAVTEAQIDNININGNAITSTDTNGNITITPNGTGEVDISKADIDGGTIDGTVIGGSTPAAISGTTGTFSGNLTVDTNTLFVDAANNRVGIGTSSPSSALDVVGDIEVSGGVYLGGPTSANLLDDYEEGTWTPTLSGGFSSAPTSYTFNSGTYTKIGRYVYFSLDLQASGATADGSALSIGGLPFVNIAAGFGGASYSYQVNFNTIATDVYHITSNSSVISVYDVAGAARAGNAAGININNRLIMFGSYQTAS